MQSQPAMMQPSAVGKHQIWSFHILFFLIELVIIFLLGFCFQYPGSATIFPVRNYPALVDTWPGFYEIWPYHQDIIVMAFIGLTFILVYLKYNGLSAITIGFMVAVLTLQLYIIFRGFWRSVFRENWWDAVNLDFSFFISGLYCVIAVMISFTACVGKLGPMQMLYASCFEVFLFTLNEYICFDQLRGFDLGGSMTVYAFGACWGCILTAMFHRATNINYNLNRNVLAHNTTTIFALIGTLLLWVFWPSLNAGRVAGGALTFGFPYGNQLHRAVLNTVLAMTGSTIAAFITSGFVNVNQFNIEHAMKATLSGAVVMAASSDLCIDPFGAILCGSFAGITTTLLFEYCHPRTKNVDTFGTMYLFLWNGIFGGFLSAMYAGTLFSDKLDTGISNLFPNGRGVSQQGGIQIAILFISLGIALFGALFAGLWVLWCPCYRPSDEDLYAQDRVLFWGRPNDLAEKELGPSAVVYVPANVMMNPAPATGMV